MERGASTRKESNPAHLRRAEYRRKLPPGGDLVEGSGHAVWKNFSTGFQNSVLSDPNEAYPKNSKPTIREKSSRELSLGQALFLHCRDRFGLFGSSPGGQV